MLAGRDDNSPLGELISAAAVRRPHHDHRLAIGGSTAEEISVALDCYLRGEVHPSLSVGRKPLGGRPRLAFVFSGQGALWCGVGRELVSGEPLFRRALEECDRCFGKLSGWSLLSELMASGPASRLGRTEVAQPVQFALQVALAALWRSWGIVPDAVVGHSLGEVAAAHVAGDLQLEEAIGVVYHRSRLMQRVAGHGKTAAVGMPVEQVRQRITDAGTGLSIAAINGPDSTIISGETAEVEELIRSLTEEGCFTRVLDADCAFHSPLLDPLRRELSDALQGLRPQSSSIPFVSTVTGAHINGEELAAEYWARNLRETVRFSSAIDRLVDDSHEIFLEVGPHPVLASAIAHSLRASQQAGAVLASLRRGENGHATLLNSLGTLYTLGQEVSWNQLYSSTRHVQLPTYPWQRERFWHDQEEASAEAHPAEIDGKGPNGALHVGINGYQHSMSGNGNGNGKSYSKNGVGDHRLAASEVVALDESDVRHLLYEVKWQSLEHPAHFIPGPTATDVAARWLIFEDNGGVARSLCSLLEARGDACILVGRGQEFHKSSERDYSLNPDDRDCFRRILESLEGKNEPPLQGVVHLWSLDAAPTNSATLEDLEMAQRLGCVSALHLAQALGSLGVSQPPPRLWVVTRGAQPVGSSSSPLAVLQAPVWGLGRSIALDRPELWGGLIDLDPDGDEADATDLLQQIIRPDGEDQVAFRKGQRFVARLVRGLARGDARFPRLHPDGTYLVTGGLGELGLRAARWLVEAGARRLVLMGRRALPSRRSWSDLTEVDPAYELVTSIREMEQLGATILVESTDVADPVMMAACWDRLRDTLPPLRGVVHAAGVITSHSVSELDLPTLRATFRAKVEGTWILHRLTRELDLDFFVTFSSIAAVLGAKEAHYAAANQFLDAFAHYAGSLGIPALSVNWGPWEGRGMAAARERAHRALGLVPLTTERAFAALSISLGTGSHQAFVAEVDWSTLKTLYAHKRNSNFLSELAYGSDLDKERGAAVPAKLESVNWRALPPNRLRDQLVRFLREQVAIALKQLPERIDPERPLNTLGVDSLTAIQIKWAIEQELKTTLPMSSLMDGPTVLELADRASEFISVPGHAPASVLSPAGEAKVDRHPLSTGQMTLWLAHQFDPGEVTNHIAGAARVHGEIDESAVRRSLQQLVNRHEALRTIFPTTQGRPVLEVQENREVWFRVEDIPHWTDAEIMHRLVEEGRRRFDLERGPLHRFYLFRRSKQEHFLLLVIHHSITDFWSTAILLDEFAQLYEAERAGTEAALAPLELRYTDFIRWQAEMLAGPEGDRHWSYWKERLAGPLPELDLPTTGPRPAIRSQRGAVRHLDLDESLSKRLDA